MPAPTSKQLQCSRAPEELTRAAKRVGLRRENEACETLFPGEWLGVAAVFVPCLVRTNIYFVQFQPYFKAHKMKPSPSTGYKSPPLRLTFLYIPPRGYIKKTAVFWQKTLFCHLFSCETIAY